MQKCQWFQRPSPLMHIPARIDPEAAFIPLQHPATVCDKVVIRTVSVTTDLRPQFACQSFKDRSACPWHQRKPCAGRC